MADGVGAEACFVVASEDEAENVVTKQGRARKKNDIQQDQPLFLKSDCCPHIHAAVYCE